MNEDSPNQLARLLLIAAIVTGAAMRCSQAAESLWLDELHTSWCVSGTLGEVAPRAAIGNQSPLYFWLAWFAARLPLPPELALRSLSLLAGGILPAAMYWLTARMLPRSQRAESTAPLLAAWLTALDPLGVYYAQEARPYALMQLLAVLHVLALFDLFVSRSWCRQAWWIASGALLVYLHFTAALLLVAEAVAVATYLICTALSGARRSGTTRRYVGLHCRQFVIDFTLLGLLLVPALPLLWQVGARQANWNSFVENQPLYEILRWFPWMIAGLVLMVVQGWHRTLARFRLPLLLSWLLVPPVIAWATTATGFAPLFFSRYLLVSWLASLVAAALLTSAIPWRICRPVFAVAVILGQVYLGGMWLNWLEDSRLLHDRNEDWQLAVATLENTVVSNVQFVPVLVRSGLIESDALRTDDDPLLREYCLAPVRGMYRIREEDADVYYPLPDTDPGKLLPETLEALLRADEALLLVRSNRDPKKMAAARAQLLRDLQSSLGAGVRIESEPPATFGSIYLQRILLRRPKTPKNATPLPD